MEVCAGAIRVSSVTSWPSAEAETQGSWVPPLDVYETQDRYVITAELAGMTTADIEIEVGVPLGQGGVEDNVLTLTVKVR